MKKTMLGRTNLVVNKDAFGALPVQRCNKEDAAQILTAALDAGINFFDTARMYTDSEEKIGLSISARRDEFVLATKTMAKNVDDFWKDLEESRKQLKCDVIDIYQFHNPPFCPLPGDGSGLYEAMQQAREKGYIRFIGFTNHKLTLAKQALESGLYDTIQFPFNYLSTEEEQAFVRECEAKNVGFICMKAMSGGLLDDVSASRAWLNNFANAVPIWGIQRMEELQKLIDAQNAGDALTEAHQKKIEADREQLSGEFCRGCGYCMPCPVDIQINFCARMPLFLRRAPVASYTTDEWKQKMEKIKDCIECGQCKEKCPYGLHPSEMLKRSYEDYQNFI